VAGFVSVVPCATLPPRY